MLSLMGEWLLGSMGVSVAAVRQQQRGWGSWLHVQPAAVSVKVSHACMLRPAGRLIDKQFSWCRSTWLPCPVLLADTATRF